MSKHALNVSASDSFNVYYSDLFGADAKIIVQFEQDKSSKLYDERIESGATDREMIESLKFGQLVAAMGEKAPGLVDGKQVVNMIDGRQRWMHIQQAWIEMLAAGSKIEDLPPFKISIKRYASDVERFEAGITANAHRHDDNAMVTARKIQRFFDLVGENEKTRDRARLLFNLKSIVAMNNILALLKLIPEIQGKVESGEIGSSAALQLTSLNVNEQKTVAPKLITGATVETIRAAARTAAGKKVTPKVLSRSAILDRIATLRNEMANATETDRKEQMAARIDELHFVLGER